MDKIHFMNPTHRTIQLSYQSQPTNEGDGVKLRRVFGQDRLPLFDPFLMMDDFRIYESNQFMKGFPWHPHRGIETITYMLSGEIEHEDSLGNKGLLGAGDVQWMTAGSGIIHQEMPKKNDRGILEGFQLWANLPASHKMMKPRYQNIEAKSIPIIKLSNQVEIKIICGQINEHKGPVKDIIIEPEYLDISVPAHTNYIHPAKRENTAIIYVISGSANFEYESEELISNQNVILFNDGDCISVQTKDSSVRFLFLLGKPIREPIAWYGPIVMNSREELVLAFDEYQNGNFIK